MEPLGTITMYYQFLGKEIVDILDKIMLDAEDYVDFCRRLVDKVCTEDVPTHLAYLAGVHVWNIGHNEYRDRIRSKYENMAHIFCWVGGYDLGDPSYGYWTEVAHSENHEDWIKAGLCIEATHLYRAMPVIHIHKYLDLGMGLIESNPLLKCFFPYFLDIRGMMKLQEGRFEDAMNDLEEGLRIAQKYDDRYEAAILLFHLGSFKMRLDVNDSWAYFDEAYRTADAIGHAQGAAFAIDGMGNVASVRGEYDLALHSYFRSKELCSDAGVWDGDNNALCRARIYSEMGEGADALVWAETAMEELRYTVYPKIEKARALILLGRLSKAASLLEVAKEEVLRDGRENTLGLYKHVSGLLELAEGRVLEGMTNLEVALDIFDQNSMPRYAIPCLVDLAKAEVKNYDIDGDLDTSGPWMSKLETRARERDYPGILMEHALLKAEFQMKQESSDAARKTLTDALNIYDSPSVKSLRKKIEERLQSMTLDA
ncbi:MAG: tetratricopeptide repeat protein [Candidatus Thorarchaeota archaeon]